MLASLAEADALDISSCGAAAGVMLAHLLCAVKAGQLSTITAQQWRQISLAVLEEELRRRQHDPDVRTVKGSGPGQSVTLCSCWNGV